MAEEITGANSTIEFSLKVNGKDRKTGEFVNVVDLNGKLTKADAGRIEHNLEEWLNINIDGCDKTDSGECGCPKVAISNHSIQSRVD